MCSPQKHAASRSRTRTRRSTRAWRETAQLEAALARVGREIENLLRAVEQGEAARTLLDRLRLREKEQAALTRQLVSARSLRTTSQLERHRIRRRIEDGFSRLGDVLSSERQLARQALDRLIVDRVRFTPVQIDGERTYRFEVKLSLGRICAAVAQNDGDVPDGIRPLLRETFRIVLTVKEAA